MSVIDSLQDITWTSPKGQAFTLKTLTSGYSQKHIGEVKENPRTSVTSSSSARSGSSTSGKKSKKSKTSSSRGSSHSTSVSTSQATKRVGDSNDTFTDMGIGGRDVSLDCYFIGKNHYTQAEAFRKALCQVGKSKLQLAYGNAFTVNVISFEVKNTLTEKVNSTIITVNWHETSASKYPEAKKSKQKEVKNQVADLKESVATAVENTTNAIESPTRLATFNSKFQGVLSKVSSALDTANNVTLNSIMSDILGQNLMSNSFTVTSQLGIIFSKSASIVRKLKTAGSSYSLLGFSSFFNGFQTLIASLQTTSLSNSISETLTPEQRDELILNDSIASSIIASAAEGLLDYDFSTRDEAVEAVKNLENLSDDWFDFADEISSKITDLNDAYVRSDDVKDIVSKVSNDILDRLFKLKVEQKIILTEDTTPLELAYKYYNEDFRNDPDGTLEYLIQTNKLVDEEFFLIPRGREIKIYV